MKRTRIKPVSERRTEENADRAAMLEDLFGPPESWCCQFWIFRTRHPEVYVQEKHALHHGEIHGHEILKRSRGGSITDPENVTLLCDFHNGWVEDFPLTAMKLGLADHAKAPNKTTVRINALNKRNFLAAVAVSPEPEKETK